MSKFQDISQEDANFFLRNSYEEFTNPLLELFQTYIDAWRASSAEIELLPDDEAEFMLYDGGNDFARLIVWENDYMPMHWYKSLETLYEEIDELFKEKLCIVNNFFCDIWIYQGSIEIQMYWCDPQNTPKKKNHGNQ